MQVQCHNDYTTETMLDIYATAKYITEQLNDTETKICKNLAQNVGRKSLPSHQNTAEILP